MNCHMKRKNQKMKLIIILPRITSIAFKLLETTEIIKNNGNYKEITNVVGAVITMNGGFSLWELQFCTV